MQPGRSNSAMWEFWTSTPTPQRLQCLTYQVVRADKHVLPLPSPSSTYRFFKNKQPCFTFELDDEEKQKSFPEVQTFKLMDCDKAHYAKEIIQ